jgi:hypothetical protein
MIEVKVLKGGARTLSHHQMLEVPHGKGVVHFARSLEGPGRHSEVMGAIDSQDLLRPTTAQTLSLVRAALQNPEDEYCAEVLSRFSGPGSYLWTGTENLGFPGGAFLYDNVDGERSSISGGQLIEILAAGDSSVRFARKGFKFGELDIEDAVLNDYTVGQIGGAESLPLVRDVATQLNKPQIAYINGLGGTDSEVRRCTAVGGYYGGLCLVGCLGGGDGYASGVSKSGEASAPKSLDKE